MSDVRRASANGQCQDVPEKSRRRGRRQTPGIWNLDFGLLDLVKVRRERTGDEEQ